MHLHGGMFEPIPAKAEDVQRVIGEVDPVICERILATGATADEIAEAVRELEDERGFGETHHVPSSPRVTEVVSILDDFYILEDTSEVE